MKLKIIRVRIKKREKKKKQTKESVKSITETTSSDSIITVKTTKDSAVVNLDSNSNDTILKEGQDVEIEKSSNIKRSSNREPRKIDVNLVTDCTDFQIINKKFYKVKPQLISSFTPERLSGYFKQESFLSIYLGVEKTKETTGINVELVFASADIKTSYGDIPLDGFLRISKVGGKNIFLKPREIIKSSIEVHSGKAIYKGKFYFENDSDIDKLKSGYIDNVGIMWSSGFEAYPVYEVDFFQKQLSDLEICIAGRQN
jgi:hypothetical protein